MKKSLMFAIIAGTIITCGAFAVDDPVSGDKRTTSQPYVEAQIETTQIKIPAANPSNTNIGNTVITYTNVEGGGVIGERELFTGGEYDADNDSGKLITASALNNAFATLPEKTTTKLECANQADGCTLWTITDQTAYGINGDGTTTTIDLASIIGNDFMVFDYTANDSSGAEVQGRGFMSNSIISGDPFAFALDYGPKGMIKGHGRCSSQVGDNNNGTWTNPTISSTLPDASGQYCYCTVDGYTPSNGTMTTLSAKWVFIYDYRDASVCAIMCADRCANYLSYHDVNYNAFQAALFGSVQ